MTIILGRVGSGKSLYAMHLLIEELRQTRRHIVTTLSVDTGELNAYVQAKYPGEDLDVCGRIHRITKEQLKHFWRARGLSPCGVPLYRSTFGDCSWEWPDQGICYFLDESQEGFNARAWAATGTEFTSYATQHRKMGDDIVAITPASGLLDKQFRMLCGECIVLDNWYRRKLGWVRAPRMITWRKYMNCPPEQAEHAIQQGRIYIDAKGLAACYRTEEGVGIVGRGADKGKYAKGIPWYMIFVLIAGVAFGVWWVSSAAMRYVQRRAMRSMPVARASAGVVGAGGYTNSVVSAAGYTNSGVSVPVTLTNGVYVRGWGMLWNPKRVMFMLSDGRTATYPSAEVSVATDRYIVYRGERFEVR